MTPKPLSRFQRLPPGRRQAILRAVEAGEMTGEEIALAFGCSRQLVAAARLMLRSAGLLDTGSAEPANAGRGGS